MSRGNPISDPLATGLTRRDSRQSQPILYAIRTADTVNDTLARRTAPTRLDLRADELDAALTDLGRS